MKSLLFLSIIHCLGFGRQIIDLGKLEIEGKIRGPEVHVIDSSRISSQSAGQLVRWQIETLERELLKPDPPPTPSNVKARVKISHISACACAAGLGDPRERNPRQIRRYVGGFVSQDR